MGRVDAICTSAQKGVRKSPVASARFLAGHGIEGDAHAGPWHRQVSLLATESIHQTQLRLPGVTAGDFAENLAVSGIEPARLGLGSRLRLGDDVELRITQIGKVCHNPCHIQAVTGDCIMPRQGLFARVEQGGSV
ncbi:MAG: MOSC domain-containing protein, partial [Thermoguttaceae bacterium]